MLALERRFGKQSVFQRIPEGLKMGLTFIFVLFTWVFFRATDLSSAILFCKSLLGFGASSDSALLLRGLIFNPYYLFTFVLAAIVIWAAPQTWDWTRRITVPKIFMAFVLFVLSILLLSMQSYNPFIYFIF